MKKKQGEDIREELEHLERIQKKKGTAAVVFGMKKKILGNKSDFDEPSAIIHPETRIQITDPSEIKSVSVDFCKKILTNKNPKAEFEEDLEWKKRVHEVRMSEKIQNDIKYTETMFHNTMKELRKKHRNKYDFIVKGGKSFLMHLISCT